MDGKLVVFEGVDGCGKTTQIGLAKSFLEAAGRRVVAFREPGGTAVGEAIRGVLKNPEFKAMTPMAELMLFMAARAQLVAELIAPALDGGSVVLLDRYYFSTAAYQGAAGKVGVEQVLFLAEQYLKCPAPDGVILLDVDPELAARRRAGPEDRIEAKGLAYQRDVRASYLRMAEACELFAVVDAARPATEVHKDVKQALYRALHGDTEHGWRRNPNAG